MKKILTIAGSDSSGGAGIQADLKTMCAYGTYGMSVITALTAQNTLTVSDVRTVDTAMVVGQIDAVFDDMGADALKVGMVMTGEIARAIRESLSRWQARNIVLDPVMVSKSGCRLMDAEAEAGVVALMDMAEVVTPNLREAEILSGMKVGDKAGMMRAAEIIIDRGARAVLVKGGVEGDNDDYLLPAGEKGLWMQGKHIDTKSTHGSGCTLSAAIACELAAGKSLSEAASGAKEYVSGAIRHAPDIGRGNGPLGHFWRVNRPAG